MAEDSLRILQDMAAQATEWISGLQSEYILSFGVVLVLITLGFQYRWRKKRNAIKMARMKPFMSFFREMSAPELDEKKFFSAIDKATLESVDRGVLKTMARTVSQDLGPMQSIVLPSAKVGARKERDSPNHRFTAESTVAFAKCKDVHCKLVWIRTPEDKRSIMSFHVKPASGPLNVMEHAKPDDFEPFGEKFVKSLFMKKPTFAISHMTASLKKKYEGGNESLLVKDFIKVYRAMGGFQDNDFDCQMSSGKRITIGSATNNNDDDATPSKQHHAVEMDLVVLGNSRNVQVTLVFLLSGLSLTVIRYQVSALPPKQKTLVVDGDQGNKPIASTQ